MLPLAGLWPDELKGFGIAACVIPPALGAGWWAYVKLTNDERGGGR